LCNCLEAALKSFPQSTESQIKEIIAETLKHAPNKAGGSNWLKVTYYCQNLIL